ncbi:MAG: DUF2283 domain-containing protein [Candidatus Magnetobacterium sp. LHC-1]|uniref:DUF2283 domain-containing protein n=1 Tax=Candidatus Magnetobacterium casense TaxID=1455061 RepID=A0ABS6S1M2_9BACT|nr:DUF2283 domain-containing protein [Candidatus Magnetobacterium casensis]MBF0606980.1 DUF2283 domain-containing protein [Nitrospirota bacterium]MBV6342748.1 DUF2283 domain-containing protein [Candidatus Magnetobacterium casensis]
MYINYNDRGDILYLRLDDRPQDVVNTRISEDIVLGIGVDDKIVAIEIINASQKIKLDRLLPVKL